MGSNALKKRMRNNECIDRISDLPDDILCKTLSYLPLKDIIATSVLSTRWKPLFPSSVALVGLDLDNLCELEIVHKFMDKLLNVTLRDVRFVERIVFNIKGWIGISMDWDGAIASWVAVFLRLNVRHLQLKYNLYKSMALFESLHGCSTLLDLELRSFADLRLPDEFILPNLKRLSLCRFGLYWDSQIDDGDLKKLLDGCPVLTDLGIIRCCFGYPDTLYIQHPNIKRLFLDKRSSWRVVIDCPNLEAVMFKDQFCVDFDLRNTKSLRSVCIDFYYCDVLKGGNQSLKLVEACSSTTRLCLTGSLLKYLNQLMVPLPTFQNLTSLVLGRMGSHGGRMLIQLLASAPNLTLLTFEEELDFKWPCTYSTSLVPRSLMNCMGSKSLLPHSTRTYMNINSSPPINLLLNVKKIEIWEFKWKPDEMKLMEYFLKEGKVLQELVVHCLPCENKRDLEKLSMLPRYSKACQVVFKDKNNLGKSHYSRENWF